MADYVSEWNEGLFGAGFSTNDVDAVAKRLSSKGVQYTEEGGQLFIAPDQTPGLRMVISKEVDRPATGLIRYLYEATNLINDHVAAGNFYADALRSRRVSAIRPIKSHDYGYTGQLTMFNPPERLDRIELSQITDREMPMGRFMTRRGGETLYMCYIECEERRPHRRASRQEGPALLARRRKRATTPTTSSSTRRRSTASSWAAAAPTSPGSGPATRSSTNAIAE